ncbi:hypothetical protein ACFL54_04970 [Planctomycetota bacterium]
MSKICKLLVVSLTVYLFMSTIGMSKEDTSREEMPRWEVDYWGNDNIGLTFEETHGRYGVVLLNNVGKRVYSKGVIIEDLIAMWKEKQYYVQKKFLDHDLYCQLMTGEYPETYSSRQELRKIIKGQRITIPVASLKCRPEFLLQCKLLDEGGMSYSGAFLIDPYGRIARRTEANKTRDMSQLQLLPYKQMRREIAEYWLDTKAEDIAKADKHFKKKKKRCEAYKIYQPLADKVKAVEAGKVIANRVEQIENEVRNSILTSLMNLTPKNLGKSMAPMKKTMREFEGTLLAEEAVRELAVLKRAKKDNELLDLIRFNAANSLFRMGNTEDAKDVYQSLFESTDDENFKTELDIRLKEELKLESKHVLNPNATPEEWLEKAEGFFIEAEKLLEGDNINQENATALLLASAEHYTAAITNSESEPPGTREQLKAARTKLFWIASQE